LEEQSIFTGADALDMAIQIERRGIDFYHKAATASNDDNVREVFDLLRGEEEKHAHIFREMKERYEDFNIPESYPGETSSYLDSFTKGEVFSEDSGPSEIGEKIGNPIQAVEFAMGIERNSILFYSGLKRVIRKSERDVIEEVITEEHGHIRKLTDLKRKL
jgi:rubrerythrin